MVNCTTHCRLLWQKDNWAAAERWQYYNSQYQVLPINVYNLQFDNLSYLNILMEVRGCLSVRTYVTHFYSEGKMEKTCTRDQVAEGCTDSLFQKMIRQKSQMAEAVCHAPVREAWIFKHRSQNVSFMFGFFRIATFPNFPSSNGVMLGRFEGTQGGRRNPAFEHFTSVGLVAENLMRAGRGGKGVLVKAQPTKPTIQPTN